MIGQKVSRYGTVCDSTVLFESVLETVIGLCFFSALSSVHFIVLHSPPLKCLSSIPPLVYFTHCITPPWKLRLLTAYTEAYTPLIGCADHNFQGTYQTGLEKHK